MIKLNEIFAPLLTRQNIKVIIITKTFNKKEKRYADKDFLP